MSNTTSSVRNVFRPRGKGLLFILGGISMLITVGIVLAILSTVTQTTKYYVLSHDVKARDQITAQDLQEVTISANGAPRSYGLAQVQTGNLYAKYNLNAGDVLSDSNVSDKLTDIRAGLPTNYVVASFTAAPAAAASGKIQSGDYVDLYVTSDSSKDQTNSHMFLQHVLVLDAQVSLDNAASGTDTTSSATGSTDAATGDASAADSSTTRQGIPSLFTVGVSQENAARLILANTLPTGSISVVLSSQSTTDANKPLPGTDVGASTTDIFSGTAPDGGAGTNPNPGETSSATGSSTDATPAPSASATPEVSTPAPSVSAGAQ